MKKFVALAFTLIVMLSVCATSLAVTKCASWMETGLMTPAVCTPGGCGFAWYWSVMKHGSPITKCIHG